MDLGEGSPQPYILIAPPFFFTFVMCLLGVPLNDPPGMMLEGSTSGQEGQAHLEVQGGRQIVADSL